MYEGTPKRVDLRPEDRDRMQRLSEEVQGRLKEMSLIAGRTLGITLGNDAIAKFDPQESKQRDDQTVEVVVIAVPDGSGGFQFGCYQDPPGICVFPC